MGKINMGRVIGGGLLAGLVMNISEFLLHGVVLKSDGEQWMADINAKGFNVSEELLVYLIGITFVVGVLAVYTYAAIRPRMGAGPKTAVCAGLLVWSLSYFYCGVVTYAAYQIFPAKMVWLPVAWGFVELPLATVIGAWLYKEE